ncbi:MAG: hypothetical protein ACK2T3_03720 [Candidatus Promineifilaceae bacterium]
MHAVSILVMPEADGRNPRRCGEIGLAARTIQCSLEIPEEKEK